MPRVFQNECPGLTHSLWIWFSFDVDFQSSGRCVLEGFVSYVMKIRVLYLHFFSSALETRPLIALAMSSPKKSSRLPKAMVLHVTYSPIRATAMLLNAAYFDEVTFDADSDSMMIWCCGMLPGRTATPEAATVRQLVPPNCEVLYYAPSHPSNPSTLTTVTDSGEENIREGTWCCCFTAPNLVDLATTFDIFASHYMGIGRPIKDNSFTHTLPNHKFLTRKNKIEGRPSWDSRHTIRLQPRGKVTKDLYTFVANMTRNHGYFLWDGSYVCDPFKLFHGTTLPTACANEAAVEAKWQAFELMRHGHQGLQDPPKPAPLPPAVLASAPTASRQSSPPEKSVPLELEKVEDKVAGETIANRSGLPPCPPSEVELMTEKADLALFKFVSHSGSSAPPPLTDFSTSGPTAPLTNFPNWHQTQSSLPGTNTWPERLVLAPKTAALAETQLDVADTQQVTEENESEAKRRRLDTSETQLMTEENESEAKRRRLDTSETGGLCNCFHELLDNVLGIVKGKYKALCTAFTKAKQWEHLQNLHGIIDMMETQLQSPDTTIPMSTAQNIVASLLHDFGTHTMLEDAMKVLQTWQPSHDLGNEVKDDASTEAMTIKDDASNEVKDILATLATAWDECWEAQKKILFDQEDWRTLDELKKAKEQVRACLSREDMPPSVQREILGVLQKIGALPYCREWHALSQAVLFMSLNLQERATDELTEEELVTAGSRQQDMHLLHGFSLASPDKTVTGAAIL
jgi:hypothetical protein